MDARFVSASVAVTALTLLGVATSQNNGSSLSVSRETLVQPSQFKERVRELRSRKIISAAIYSYDITSEGKFEPEMIIDPEMSARCELEKTEAGEILDGLELLRPIKDGEKPSNNVNMAVVFEDIAGVHYPVFFFYPIPKVPINAIFGGSPYRASSEFPKLVVQIARRRCGSHWPFPIPIDD